MATRAKTHLILIFAEPEEEYNKGSYANYQKYFQTATKGSLNSTSIQMQMETKMKAKDWLN